MRRMMLLAAAPSMKEVPTSKPERCHALKGDRKNQFAVDLKHPFRLVFVPDHDPIPRTRDGGIELKSVIKIKILNVEDYHK